MFWEIEVSARPAFDAVAFGQRVRAAREATGLSQTEVAEALAMSQPTYSRLEKGEIASDRITSVLLDDLSRAVGRSMSFLFAGSPVRDRVRLAARRHDDEEVRARADRVLELLEIDDDLDDPLLTGEAKPDCGRKRWAELAEWAQREVISGKVRAEQGVVLADWIRGELELGIGPVRNMASLVENELGVDVAVVALGDGLSAVAAFDDERSVALVAVQVAESSARQRFSLGHELCHVLVGDGHALNADPSRSPAERRADKFAQNFLLPAGGIRHWLSNAGYGPGERVSFDDACVLADSYSVSPVVVWMALQDLGIQPEESAPTAARAALVAGHLTRFQQREQSAEVERVPQRIEARILAALRRGHLNVVAAAGALGVDVEAVAAATGGMTHEHQSPAPSRAR